MFIFKCGGGGGGGGSSSSKFSNEMLQRHSSCIRHSFYALLTE